MVPSVSSLNPSVVVAVLVLVVAVVTVVGIVGYYRLQLDFFDAITGMNPYATDEGILGAVSAFAAAQTAMTIGAGAGCPFDAVRRRLQMLSAKPVEEQQLRPRAAAAAFQQP